MEFGDGFPKPYVIACGVLGKDVRRVAGDMGISLGRIHCLPGGLHESPDKLRSTLQGIIDELSDTSQWSHIVVGYGVCGRGTVDLKAGAIPLVIPRVHDCLSLFLGGDNAYRQELKRFPGTYYISPGWYAEKSTPASQQQHQVYIGGRQVGYDELVNRVGQRGARKTVEFFNSWKRNYQRAVFIDTGDDGGPASAHARRMAEENGWRYETLQADMRLLAKLLTAERQDREVLVVPPGHITYFDPLSEGLAAKPPHRHGAGRKKDGKTAQWRVGDTIEPRIELQLGLGIDAGGTYTDAVIFDFKDRKVIAKNKALTTRWDFAVGIRQALAGLNSPKLEAVELAAVSTTLATNAMVERDGQQVGLMLMAPEGVFSVDNIDHHPIAQIAGRLSIAGDVMEPVDEDQVREVARQMIKRHQVDAFAVSGYAGHINMAHELQVKEIIKRETGRFVCCGHELSNLLNFVVRAQTAVVNARIIPRLGKLVADLRRLLNTMGIGAPMVFVKGDGSVMTADMAVERPVETILSGPAASAAGARFLTKRRNAVVVDVGGTTMDMALIANDTVAIRESGAFVGGFHTHVKALDIRTTGLGGDSHVIYHNGVFQLGPRRVTPMAWLASAAHPLERGLDFLEQRTGSAIGSTRYFTLIALAPGALPPQLTPEEQSIVDVLGAGPASLVELTHRTGIQHPNLLPLSRLLAHNSIYQCGLTPTDLLHAMGKLDLWDRDTAMRASALTARAAGLSVEELFHTIRERMIRTMAVDIIKKHLDQQKDPETIDNCPICGQLIDIAFGKHTGPLQARYRLTIPIIGIGAAAGFFLPHAGRLLDADVLLPEHQDVANAIGAVTSQVKVIRQVAIKPGMEGGFYVEGIVGNDRFPNIEAAQEAAVGYLLDTVRRIGARAGTSHTAVHFSSRDRTVHTALNEDLFMERVIDARLSGPPDCMLSKGMA
jgi:N-methylhydantoinase A/oxoprolinase/acetone carboxylase beta subunit